MKKWNKERFATIWEKLESMIALRSLRARIFLLTLVIGLVPCIAMRHGIVSNYEDLAVEQRTTVVQNQLMILANHLIRTPAIPEKSSMRNWRCCPICMKAAL